jgi:hypothetical protein
MIIGTLLCLGVMAAALVIALAVMDLIQQVQGWRTK